jgi:hypothetical protein
VGSRRRADLAMRGEDVDDERGQQAGRDCAGGHVGTPRNLGVRLSRTGPGDTYISSFSKVGRLSLARRHHRQNCAGETRPLTKD